MEKLIWMTSSGNEKGACICLYPTASCQCLNCLTLSLSSLPPTHPSLSLSPHSSKPSKQAFLETLLATPTSDGSGATPSSEGYVSEEESEGEEGGVEVVEDYEALEEEGVTGLTKSKYAVREVSDFPQ